MILLISLLLLLIVAFLLNWLFSWLETKASERHCSKLSSAVPAESPLPFRPNQAIASPILPMVSSEQMVEYLSTLGPRERRLASDQYVAFLKNWQESLSGTLALTKTDETFRLLSENRGVEPNINQSVLSGLLAMGDSAVRETVINSLIFGRNTRGLTSLPSSAKVSDTDAEFIQITDKVSERLQAASAEGAINVQG